MTTTYTECPQCGKRALSVATRCPQCGFNFPPRPIDRSAEAPSLRRSVPAVAVAGGLLAAILLAAVLVRRSPPKSRAAGAPPPGSDTVVASVTPPSEPSPPAPLSESLAPVPPPVTAPAAAAPGNRRYARTWVNIRGDRSRSAASVGILNPGDQVVVDSLVRGWYRVLVDGRFIGYAHRSGLSPTPPE